MSIHPPEKTLRTDIPLEAYENLSMVNDQLSKAKRYVEHIEAAFISGNFEEKINFGIKLAQISIEIHKNLQIRVSNVEQNKYQLSDPDFLNQIDNIKQVAKTGSILLKTIGVPKSKTREVVEKVKAITKHLSNANRNLRHTENAFSFGLVEDVARFGQLAKTNAEKISTIVTIMNSDAQANNYQLPDFMDELGRAREIIDTANVLLEKAKYIK